MRKALLTSLLVAVGLTVGINSTAAAAQTDQAQDTSVTNKTAALKALDTMSTYLGSLDKFTIQASVNADEVLESGQKVQLSRSVSIKADQPSRLWVKRSNMYRNQEFFFDGKTFTISTPELGYYAAFDAPATISDVIVKARDTFNVDLPLSDLFLWGSKKDAQEAVDDAMIVGLDQINGIDCTQFAFRSQEIDWQIWIQRDNAPLPLKLVVTSKKQTGQPQYSAVLNWNTTPTLNNNSFTFTPADGDKQINFNRATTRKEETTP